MMLAATLNETSVTGLQPIGIHDVTSTDLSQLVVLETCCFATNRLSQRSFSHWIKSSYRVFLVAKGQAKITAYGLVIMRKSTRLARLNSIAVDQHVAGKVIGQQLLLASENKTVAAGKLFLRLEVEKPINVLLIYINRWIRR